MNKTKIMITTKNNTDFVFYSVHDKNDLLNMYVRDGALPLNTDFWIFCDKDDRWGSIRASEIQAAVFSDVTE